MKRSYLMIAMLGAVVAACDENNGPTIGAPQNLRYLLDASGDPDAPAGLLLEWDPVADDNLRAYNIYSRLDGSGQFDLRGTTTSLSFHDVGIPDIEYYVTSVDDRGDESEPSEFVLIDERLRLESPNDLVTTSLDGAVHMAWTDNAFQNEPDGFLAYRVYSTSYDLDNNECGLDWSLEGTTVSPEFISSELVNGLSSCFAVSAESIEGWESLWSPIRADTPRPDARNVLVTADGFDPATSGFRFFLDGNTDGVPIRSELGIVTAGSRNDIDFYVADNGGSLFLFPVRAGTSIALYGNDPIDDLTDIDIAPETGFATTAVEAVPGFGYVFEMDGGDGFARFGGLRTTHVGADYIIFDWSYQTDPGNPELRRHGGLPTAGGKPLVIKGVR